MSRVPVYLKPSPLELTATSFSVLSGEWTTGKGTPHTIVATIAYDQETRCCTIIPEHIWIENHQFPASPWVGDANAVESLLASRALTYYSRHLMRQVLHVIQARDCAG